MTRFLECLGCAAVTVLSFALYTAVFLIAPFWTLAAFAQDYHCRYERRTYPAWDTWTGTVVTRERYVRRCHRPHAYYLPEDAPRVYGYRRDRDGDEYGGGVNCREPLRATGDDRLTQERAEISAQERWALQVETRMGGIYSDIRFAADIRTTCVQRVPSSQIERTQANIGLRHHLCEVQARPCRAPAIRQDEDSRAKRRSERVEEPPPRRDR